MLATLCLKKPDLWNVLSGKSFWCQKLVHTICMYDAVKLQH